MNDYNFVSDELEKFENPDYSNVPSKKAMKGVLYIYISLLAGLIAYAIYVLVHIRG